MSNESQIEETLVPAQGRRPLNLGNILDLTISEIFILQLLLAYDKPTQRYSLLQNINNCIPGEKSITPGTLYRQLDSYEKRGFVKYERNQNGKITAVSATPAAQEIVNQVLSLTATGSADFKSQLDNVIAELMQNKDFKTSERILFFDPSVPPRVQFIERLMSLGDNSHFLDVRDNYGVIFDMVGEINLKRTVIDEGYIHEPNDHFDLVIMLGYEIPTFRKMLQDCFQELHRVLRTGGKFFIVTFNRIHPTSHFILNGVANVVNQLIQADQEEEDLASYIKNLNLETGGVSNSIGMLYGWGIKP